MGERPDTGSNRDSGATARPPGVCAGSTAVRRDSARVRGRIASFAEIAKREGQGERHIRLLAPLAFVSPRIIAAIVDGSAPADLTVTGLARALPYSWAEQEHDTRAREPVSVAYRTGLRRTETEIKK